MARLTLVSLYQAALASNEDDKAAQHVSEALQACFAGGASQAAFVSCLQVKPLPACHSFRARVILLHGRVCDPLYKNE